APWLSVVARNAALTMLRKQAARARHETFDEARDPVALDMDPAEVAATGQTADTLRQALQRLPIEQQNVVQLAYFHFLTLSQIAKRTQTPLGTVKRRAQRALQQLRALLHDEEPDHDPSV
ncbi:MAG: sigma-70 family RNA polymerase sigma factor, partial [Candidatus Eremiobacteraeota bacterium]|nr:sigma-70 family RNA polymerase sigma factor [Candidatus Eremiobacteraeota bacterium]